MEVLDDSTIISFSDIINKKTKMPKTQWSKEYVISDKLYQEQQNYIEQLYNSNSNTIIKQW